MKCSFEISSFLEEISSLSPSVVFLYFFALFIEEGFFKSLLAILWNSRWKSRRDGKNTQKNCTKKVLNDLDNHDGVVTQPEPDILEYGVKWALGSTALNKASEGDGISGEIFKILKNDAIKVLHSIYQ